MFKQVEDLVLDCLEFSIWLCFSNGLFMGGVELDCLNIGCTCMTLGPEALCISSGAKFSPTRVLHKDGAGYSFPAVQNSRTPAL